MILNLTIQREMEFKKYMISRTRILNNIHRIMCPKDDTDCKRKGEIEKLLNINDT